MTTSFPPLRLLLIAEACNPEWTSVPLVGYNLARALCSRSDLRVTLASHPRNRPALEKDPISSMAEILYPDNDYVAGTLYRFAQLLRGNRGKGWTTNTAFQSISYLFFEKELFKLTRNRLLSNEFDLIHRITPVTPTVGSPIASWTNIPTILGPLNGGLPWPKEFPSLRAKENEFLVPLRNAYKLLPYYRSTYRQARAIISGSQHTASEIPPSFTGKKYLLPENGIDPSKFLIASDWQPPSDKFRFITVGRLVPYKGLWLTLQAIRDSPSLQQHSELLVVGDGPDRSSLEALALNYGISHCVKFLGQQDQTEVSRLMRSSQCFVFPSLREFGGGVVIEAMASGIPSIIVDYGGPRDLIDSSCGILLPLQPENLLVPSLRSAMERILSQPDLCRQFAKNSASKISDFFTWDKKAAQISGIYQETLSPKN